MSKTIKGEENQPLYPTTTSYGGTVGVELML